MSLTDLKSKEFLAIGGSVLVATLAIIGAVIFLPMSSAKYLPAESTLALLHNVSPRQAEQIKTWLLELDVFKVKYESQDIALIKSGSGIATVIFVERYRLAPNEEPTDYKGRYAVFADEDGHKLITDVENPLHRTTPYKRIKRHLDSLHWAYVKPEVLAKPTGWAASLVHSLIVQDDEWLGIDHEVAPPTLVAYSESSTKTVSAFELNSAYWLKTRCGDLGSTWHWLNENLSDDEQVQLTSLLKHRLEAAFGNNVSFELELLPLINHLSELKFQTNGSGATTFTLVGRHRSAEKVADLFDRLHEGISQAAPTVEVAHFTFDERFTSTSLRLVDETVNMKGFKKHGYQVKTLSTAENPNALTTMFNQTQFLVSNQPISPIEPLEAHGSKLTCQGSFNLETIAKKLGLRLQNERPYHPLAPLAENPLNWQQSQSGPIRTVRIE